MDNNLRLLTLMQRVWDLYEDAEEFDILTFQRIADALIKDITSPAATEYNKKAPIRMEDLQWVERRDLEEISRVIQIIQVEWLLAHPLTTSFDWIFRYWCVFGPMTKEIIIDRQRDRDV